MLELAEQMSAGAAARDVEPGEIWAFTEHRTVEETTVDESSDKREESTNG